MIVNSRFSRKILLNPQGQMSCDINIGSIKVSNYFSLNDMTHLTLKAYDVYCFKGSCDKTQSYIYKTKRHLAVRVQEYLCGRS